MKNTSYHSGINQTPYKALFGCDPRSGLRSTTLPTEVMEALVTEEDFEAAFGNTLHRHPAETVEAQPHHVEPAVVETADEPAVVETADELALIETAAEPATVETDTDLLPTASQSSPVHRKRAREGLLKQAERMVKRSRLINVPGKTGDNVTACATGR